MSVEWIDFDGDRARFAGSVRGFDEAGHQVFQLRIGDSSPLYGEYRPKWADDKTDFDIEIVRFGFFDGAYVGSPYERGLQRFSVSEQSMIERLIRSLLNSKKAQKGTVPFSLITSRFLGGVHFLPGWILQSG